MGMEINPKVLDWAFARSGRSLIELQKRFPQYEAWKNRKKEPTVRQLEDYAKFTRVPFGYLVLDEPPVIPFTPVKDFRTVESKSLAPREYSTELRDTINTMRMRQEWLHDYKRENEYLPVSWIGCAKELKDDVHTAIRKMRAILQVDVDWYTNKKIKTKEEAFHYFWRKMEDAGVIVFVNGVVGNDTHRPLSIDEFRGFGWITFL